MANRYWVGGTGTWNTSSTTNWSASSGGAGGASVPTSADSVFFDRTGTYTVTLTGALNCLNFNISAGAVTFTSTGTINIAGSVSITNVTPTWSATGTLTFTATTTQTIASNGTTFNCSMTFNGIGGIWQLSSALTTSATSTITLTNGTLNLNNFTLTCGLFSSNNSNTRTLAFGTGSITITGTGTVWTTATVTGLTVTGTPVVNVTNNTATATTVSSGALSEANSISFNFTAGTYALTFLGGTSYTARNVNFTGFAGTWNATASAVVIYGSLTISTGMNLSSTSYIVTFGGTSGTKTITTNGKTLDFSIAFNGVGSTWQLQDNFTAGSTRTVTLSNGILDLNNRTLTTGIFNSTNTNTRSLLFGTGNITVVGSGTVWTTANYTGLTITGTPVVNVTNNTAIATTIYTGGLSESSSISFNFTAGTYALTLYNGSVNSINFTGFAGSITAGIPLIIFGNLTVSTGMTIPASSSTTTFAATSGTKTITSNGKTFDFPITFNGVGGTWQLQDALSMGSTRAVNLTGGTLDLNGKTFTTGSSFTVSGTSTRNITFNGGTLTCTGSYSAFTAYGSSFTTTKGTGEGYITLLNSSNKTFAGGGFIYNCTLYIITTLSFTTTTISGANTFRNILTDSDGTGFGFVIIFPDSITTTFLVGFGLDYGAIISSTPGTQATISLSSGTIYPNSLSISDNNATGGAIWKAKENFNGGNNFGWIFIGGIGGFFSFF